MHQAPPPLRNSDRQTEPEADKQRKLLPGTTSRVIGVFLLLATVGMTSCQAFLHSFPSLLP